MRSLGAEATYERCNFEPKRVADAAGTDDAAADAVSSGGKTAAGKRALQNADQPNATWAAARWSPVRAREPLARVPHPGFPTVAELRGVLDSRPDLMRAVCRVYIQDFACFGYDMPRACQQEAGGAPSLCPATDGLEEQVASTPGILRSDSVL